MRELAKVLPDTKRKQKASKEEEEQKKVKKEFKINEKFEEGYKAGFLGLFNKQTALEALDFAKQFIGKGKRAENARQLKKAGLDTQILSVLIVFDVLKAHKVLEGNEDVLGLKKDELKKQNASDLKNIKTFVSELNKKSGLNSEQMLGILVLNLKLATLELDIEQDQKLKANLERKMLKAKKALLQFQIAENNKSLQATNKSLGGVKNFVYDHKFLFILAGILAAGLAALGISYAINPQATTRFLGNTADTAKKLTNKAMDGARNIVDNHSKKAIATGHNPK
jgi:hypothetical protein